MHQLVSNLDNLNINYGLPKIAIQTTEILKNNARLCTYSLDVFYDNSEYKLVSKNTIKTVIMRAIN